MPFAPGDSKGSGWPCPLPPRPPLKPPSFAHPPPQPMPRAPMGAGSCRGGAAQAAGPDLPAPSHAAWQRAAVPGPVPASPRGTYPLEEVLGSVLLMPVLEGFRS